MAAGLGGIETVEEACLAAGNRFSSIGPFVEAPPMIGVRSVHG